MEEFDLRCCAFGADARIDDGPGMMRRYLSAKGKPVGSGKKNAPGLAVDALKKVLALQGDPGATWAKARRRHKTPAAMGAVLRDNVTLDTVGPRQLVYGRMGNLKDQGYYLWYAVKMLLRRSSQAAESGVDPAELEQVVEAAGPGLGFSAPMEVMLDPEGGWNIEMNDVYVFLGLDALEKTKDVAVPNYFPMRMVLAKEQGWSWIVPHSSDGVFQTVDDRLARAVLPGNVLLFSRADAGYYTCVTARELCQILAHGDGVVRVFYESSAPHVLYFRHRDSAAQVDPDRFVELSVVSAGRVSVPTRWVRHLPPPPAPGTGRRSSTRCSGRRVSAGPDAFVRLGAMPPFRFEGCSLAPVLADLAWYTQVNDDPRFGAHHEGTLVQHSEWTSQLVRRWVDEGDPRALGVPPEHADLAVLCATLHDIGKAGDGDRTRTYKPWHPRAALEYLTGRRSYLRVAPERARLVHMQIQRFLSSACGAMTPRVVAVVAAVAAVHYNLGLVMQKKMSGDDWVKQLMAACCKRVPGTDRPLAAELSPAGFMALGRIALAVSLADVIAGRAGLDDSDPDAPWQKYGYHKGWGTAAGGVLQRLASALGLPRDDPLLVGTRAPAC
jgi:hypothetical protein